MTNDELAALDRAATLQGDGNALTDLEIALVNLYRANQLVLIGPDAVERVARALVKKSNDLWDIYFDHGHAREYANAALAALGVK